MTPYADVVYYRAYFLSRGVDVSLQLDPDIASALLVSTEYIDDTYSFKGGLADDAQEHKFPRHSLYDCEGVLIDSLTIPDQVKNATSELAFIQQTQQGGLQPLFDGLVIKSQKNKLGPLEQDTEFDSKASSTFERYYAKAIKKISCFIINSSSNVMLIDRII